MAKQIASQNAAADLATAKEVGVAEIGTVIDNIPEGQSASVTDNSPIQGEINISGDFKSEFSMPYTNKAGDVLGEILVQRL